MERRVIETVLEEAFQWRRRSFSASEQDCSISSRHKNKERL